MVQIRTATENDLQQMLEIYNDIIANTTAVFQYDLHTLEMRKEWFAQKQKDGFPVFVAEENNEVVGFSTIGAFRNWQAYKYSVENIMEGLELLLIYNNLSGIVILEN